MARLLEMLTHDGKLARQVVCRSTPVRLAPPSAEVTCWAIIYNGSVMPETSRRRSVVTREAVDTALIETLAKEPHVIAGYLFGSLARGTAGPLSDVDVALLIRDSRESQAACDRTTDQLCRRLQMSRVEVISLADTPMPLRYRVVRDGSLVACRDAGALERFVTETVLQYLDFKPLRDRAFGIMQTAILEQR